MRNYLQIVFKSKLSCDRKNQTEKPLKALKRKFAVMTDLLAFSIQYPFQKQHEKRLKSGQSVRPRG